MVVNGKQMDLEQGITVEELLGKLNIQKDAVVVEVDTDIVAKDEYSLKKLNTDSVVEIIRFVGGG